MSTRTVVLVALAFCALAIVALLLVWPEPSDEDRIREAIQQVAEGARNADVGMTMKPVSAAYLGEEGLTRDEIRGLLFREYRRRGPITVLLTDIDVTVEGDRATAGFSAFLADGIRVAGLDFTPGDAEAFHFQVELAREDGDWKIVAGSHERIAPEDWPAPSLAR